MVGDRLIDAMAAERNGMASVGVTWGYGSREELTGNGGAVLCESVAALPGRVLALVGG